MLAVSMSPPVAHYPAVQKRPKLSLQTSELPISYGTSSRGLSTIATPTAAVTPTTLNTFNNTYDLSHRPSPTSASASPSILHSTTARNRLSRSQSPRPKRIEAAYTVNLPYGIKPILKNTPFPQVKTNTISASPRSNARRIFFPAPKQVGFRTAIEEDIVTKVYTARHSDLFPDGTEPGTDKSSESAPHDRSVSSEKSKQGSSISLSSTKCRKCRRNSVELIASTVSSSTMAEVQSIPPATPSGTRKRRKWEWTLAPLRSPTQSKEEVASTSEPEAQPSSSSPESESDTETDTESESVTIEDSGQASLSPDTSESSSCSHQPQVTRAQPQPHPQPSPSTAETQNLPRSLSSTSKPPRPTVPSLRSPLLQSQRRAGSLDSSPRKRKAECLDTAGLTVNAASSVGAADISDTAAGATARQGSAAGGQMGSKRRERAATL